jgi:hypothetical protein
MYFDALHLVRSVAADAEFEAYDFGTARVEDAGGWESTTPGNSITQVIYLANVEDPDGPTDKCSFTVLFEGEENAVVVDAYALVHAGGVQIGKRGTVEPPAGPRI